MQNTNLHSILGMQTKMRELHCIMQSQKQEKNKVLNSYNTVFYPFSEGLVNTVFWVTTGCGFEIPHWPTKT